MAIQEGFDVEIDGPVADDVVENARQLARTWELWQPDRFRAVGIRSRAARTSSRPEERAAEISLYSGGVDSTAMLVRRGRRPNRSSALTIHGMDYDEKDDEAFSGLVRQTGPFLERQNSRGSPSARTCGGSPRGTTPGA